MEQGGHARGQGSQVLMKEGHAMCVMLWSKRLVLLVKEIML